MEIACTDEVKVYKDEGEEDEQKKSSENLTEDKVGLVIEGEGQCAQKGAFNFGFLSLNDYYHSFFPLPFVTGSPSSFPVAASPYAAAAAAMAAAAAAAAAVHHQQGQETPHSSSCCLPLPPTSSSVTAASRLDNNFAFQLSTTTTTNTTTGAKNTCSLQQQSTGGGGNHHEGVVVPPPLGLSTDTGGVLRCPELSTNRSFNDNHQSNCVSPILPPFGALTPSLSAFMAGPFYGAALQAAAVAAAVVSSGSSSPKLQSPPQWPPPPPPPSLHSQHQQQQPQPSIPLSLSPVPFRIPTPKSSLCSASSSTSACSSSAALSNFTTVYDNLAASHGKSSSSSSSSSPSVIAVAAAAAAAAAAFTHHHHQQQSSASASASPLTSLPSVSASSTSAVAAAAFHSELIKAANLYKSGNSNQRYYPNQSTCHSLIHDNLSQCQVQRPLNTSELIHHMHNSTNTNTNSNNNTLNSSMIHPSSTGLPSCNSTTSAPSPSLIPSLNHFNISADSYQQMNYKIDASMNNKHFLELPNIETDKPLSNPLSTIPLNSFGDIGLPYGGGGGCQSRLTFPTPTSSSSWMETSVKSSPDSSGSQQNSGLFTDCSQRAAAAAAAAAAAHVHFLSSLAVAAAAHSSAASPRSSSLPNSLSPILSLNGSVESSNHLQHSISSHLDIQTPSVPTSSSSSNTITSLQEPFTFSAPHSKLLLPPHTTQLLDEDDIGISMHYNKPFKPIGGGGGGLSSDICSPHTLSRKSVDHPVIKKHANHNNINNTCSPITSNMIASPPLPLPSSILLPPSSTDYCPMMINSRFNYNLQRISPELEHQHSSGSAGQIYSTSTPTPTPRGGRGASSNSSNQSSVMMNTINKTSSSNAPLKVDPTHPHNHHPHHHRSTITTTATSSTTITTTATMNTSVKTTTNTSNSNNNNSNGNNNTNNSSTTTTKRVHIKKPLNAFMLFMKDMRSKVQEECTLKESAAINQILGKKWHELSREKQAKYYEMARKEKEIHHQLFPGWSARDNYAIHSRRKKKRKLAAAAAAAAAVAVLGQSKSHSNSGKLFNKSGLFHLSSESGGDFGNSDSTDERGGCGGGGSSSRLSLLTGAGGGTANSTDVSSAKKCRARFGLEHQNRWCKPCRRKKKCIRFLTDAEYEEDNNLLPISPVSSSSPNIVANSSKTTTPTVAITAAAAAAVNSTVTTQTNLPHYCPINQFPTSLPSSSNGEVVVSCLNMLSGDPGSSSLWTNYPPNMLHHHPLSLNNNNDSTGHDAINERLLAYRSRNSHSIADLTTPTSTTVSSMTTVQLDDNNGDGGHSCSRRPEKSFKRNSFSKNNMLSSCESLNKNNNWSSVYKNSVYPLVENPSSSSSTAATLKSNLLLLQDTFKPAKISPSSSPQPPPPLPALPSAAAASGSLLSAPIPTSPQPPPPSPLPIHLPMSTSSDEDVNYCRSSTLLNPSYNNNNHEKCSKAVTSCSSTTTTTPSSSSTATTTGIHASSSIISAARGNTIIGCSTVDIFCKPEGD
ncbi:unnamed protein product [Trichobilharzia szidati]|nr:unnamed protein product [Trichobilharzia szidati]